MAAQQVLERYDGKHINPNLVLRLNWAAFGLGRSSEGTAFHQAELAENLNCFQTHPAGCIGGEKAYQVVPAANHNCSTFLEDLVIDPYESHEIH